MEGPVSKEGRCPRCHGETIQLGTPVIMVGKTRGLRVSVRQCPNCLLVFYEELRE